MSTPYLLYMLYKYLQSFNMNALSSPLTNSYFFHTTTEIILWNNWNVPT